MAQAARAIDYDDHGAPFLGVKRSAKGFVWHERLDALNHPAAVAISQRFDLPELLGRVLAGRGVAVDDAEQFLEPSIKALMPDPSTVLDVDAGAARIADAVEANQKVAIFGDYDVDGACSSALMQLFLGAHDIGCRVYIPDRIFEGYGPNPGAMEALVKDGAQLIVTVDCGTTSFEPLEVAASSVSMLSWSTTIRPMKCCRRRSPSLIPIAKMTCPGSVNCARPASSFCCWLR